MHVRDAGDIGKDAGHLAGSFSHYTQADHADAASAHFKEAYKADYGKKSPSTEGARHLRASLAHNRLANSKTQKSSNREQGNVLMKPNIVLSKAGPGSRGGAVIGTTRSGKPIYQHGGGTENYHAIDHTDAAESHGAHGMLARVKGDVGGMNHHRAMAKEHLDAAAGPKPSASARPIHQRIKEHFSNIGHGGAAMAHAKSFSGTETSLLKAEGSRGGKIIGHTKSNKAIYASGMHTSKFTREDHANAMKVHGNRAVSYGNVGDHETATHHSKLAQKHFDGFMSAKKSLDAAEDESSPSHLAKSCSENNMNGVDLLKSYLAKSKVRSGNVDADSVDEVDADMTGASAMGKDDSAPGGWDDQPAADKKTKKKFKGHDQSDSKNAGRSVEAQTGVGSVSVGESTLSSAGPYNCDGGDVGTISEPSPTKTIDGNVYRSMDENDGDEDRLEKAEGARGGKVIGHTKSNKPIYQSGKVGGVHTRGWSKQDHKDASNTHRIAGDKAAASDSKGSLDLSDHHFVAANAHASFAEKMKKSEAERGGESDFYKGGNGKLYQRQVHDFGVVQHVAGGMDQYCAELAKGGTFWANGSNWHNTSDPGVAQMVMCKSCDHAHSVMYTSCPECQASGDFSKSMAQPSLHFAGPSRMIEPESEIVRFK
jgi:hypothetical protein